MCVSSFWVISVVEVHSISEFVDLLVIAEEEIWPFLRKKP